MKENKIIGIAKICHEANKVYCETLGDNTQTSWDNAPDWQKQSAIKGVKFHLENPSSKPSDSHESWLQEKRENGWKYGKVKDPEKKEHPCFVPFGKLPKKQQLKDVLFSNIVKSFSKNNTFNFRCEMDEGMQRDEEIIANKTLRKNLDTQLQNLKKCPMSRERSLAITKLQESIMWLGMDLKRLNEPNPYPQSYNAENTEIEETADNLKL